MTTRTVTDSRQRFCLAPNRIALKHRVLPATEWNVAHNNIRQQEYFPTDEHSAATQLAMPAQADLRPAQNAAIDSAIAGVPLRVDAANPCRVLIVDDDELIVSKVATLLARSGYEVCVALSGEHAMQVLDATTCQIVITDWHMPDMDGLDLCRNIRSRADKAYIYVLMLTVRNGRGDILAGLSAGADDYVVKGATAEEILARLEVGRRIT